MLIKCSHAKVFLHGVFDRILKVVDTFKNSERIAKLWLKIGKCEVLYSTINFNKTGKLHNLYAVMQCFILNH